VKSIHRSGSGQTVVQLIAVHAAGVAVLPGCSHNQGVSGNGHRTEDVIAVGIRRFEVGFLADYLVRPGNAHLKAESSESRGYETRQKKWCLHAFFTPTSPLTKFGEKRDHERESFARSKRAGRVGSQPQPRVDA